MEKKLVNTVSLLTITQFSRFECIKILFEIIKNQTYKNIIEWVIVEGSKTDLDASKNESNIQNLILLAQSELNFPIVYVKREKNAKLGELRNIGNNTCKADITVCMDDDDYYPSDRVEHAVKKLSGSNCLVAGCSNHLMYDYDLNMLIQMKSMGKNHSINSCMAWKKKYLLTNSHDPNKDFGEEASFTKNFTEQMIPLDPNSSIVISSHSSNTFNKKIFFIYAANNITSNVDKIIKTPIQTIIPTNIYSQYKKIFNQKTINTACYDIVYMCGTLSINWDPENKGLGGSEQAVVNLSESWVRNGKSVIVYGEVPDKIINGVIYKSWKNFDYNIQYKNLILWRIYGVIAVCPFNVKADNIIFDIHDNFNEQNKINWKNFYKYANKIFVKSNYHKQCFLENIDNTSSIQNILEIIPNGIRQNNFLIGYDTNLIEYQRNPYRFCYCSCYTRGLDKIITILWPIIYKYEPRAELHVYYGIDSISDENYKKYLQLLLGLPGIMDHGRQPMDMIVREKHLSTFHLYLSTTDAEIDCISIRESIVAGCIPIISNFGVFKERPGIHFDFNNDKDIKMSAVKIIDLFKNPTKILDYKKQIIDNVDLDMIADWDNISNKWKKFLI